jgi:tRNA modification GTPase
MQTLAAAGASPVAMSDWARRDLCSVLRAQAEMDLARASTMRTAEILLEQSQGALESEVRCIITALTTVPHEASVRLRGLIERGVVGMHLVPGWRVALAGRPNVGKSRLLNALAGFDRAIVDPTPGTTRDVVSIRTAFDGWPVELADTAGVRASSDPVEAAGVTIAESQHRTVDLVLLVLDRSEPLRETDRLLRARHPDALVVANKCDLPAVWELSNPSIVAVSAERGDGIANLVKTIARRLVIEPPPPGAGVPFRRSQVLRLKRAESYLHAGESSRSMQVLQRLLR